MSDSIDFFYSLFQYSKAGNYYFIWDQQYNQTFISQILTVLSPLKEKFNFSIPWDLNQKVQSAIKPAK